MEKKEITMNNNLGETRERREREMNAASNIFERDKTDNASESSLSV